MKRVLGSTMGHRECFDSIKHGKFGNEEYKFFCKLCDADGSSSFTLEDLKDRSYGFDLAYKYCMDNDETFPEITVFANSEAITALCQISFGKDIHIYYKFGAEKRITGTWNELVAELDSTIDLLARILDA
jgi:hypothetical protein